MRALAFAMHTIGRFLREYGGALILMLCFFVGWEWLARMYNAPYMFPSPTQILIRLWELRVSLISVHLPATLKVILAGLAISIIGGGSLAIWMSMSKLAERAFYPIVISSQTIPVIAIAPIFALWFDYGFWSILAVTVLLTFFPITVGIYDGLRSTSSELIDLMRTMGASKSQIFFKVQIPSALPYFYSGLKVAVTLSVIGAAVGEWLGATAGLGYFSRRMGMNFDGAGIFAPIILLSLLGISLFLVVKLIEHKTLKWRNIK